MAESIIQKAGGGAASDECTAAKPQVLAGYTAVTKDSGDEPAAGTMVDRGAVSQALNCGGSYTIPAGYHNGSGKVTDNSLASQTGGATAEDKYVLNGKTYWKDGVKRAGSMTVASVASFSVAAYSTSQVLATWKNPGRGPYSGVAICAKTGGYPANINDGRVYTGVGSNSAVNGTSSQVIGGLAAGTTYYFRIWVYCTCSAGDQYSGYLQTTCAPTAHGRAAYTSSGTFTVPAGVRSINVHCTGGGGAGITGNANRADAYGGGGGGGGYTVYKNSISVSPGSQIFVTVGNGATSSDLMNGGESHASMNGTVLVSAKGGPCRDFDFTEYMPHEGGSGGGSGAHGSHPAEAGCSDGASSTDNPGYGKGQGTSTKEFGTGTLYAGGGGGGASSKTTSWSGGAGGAGGGGAGGSYPYAGNAGSVGTGGGGGGGNGGTNYRPGGPGGSGNVIITW